jgi:hypothetical protein
MRLDELSEGPRLYKLDKLLPSCARLGSAIAMSDQQASFVPECPAYHFLVKKDCRLGVFDKTWSRFYGQWPSGTACRITSELCLTAVYSNINIGWC